MLTWSFGWTSSPASEAITSFAFMFEEVPEPVWNTSIGNWSSSSPAATRSPAIAIRSARSASRSPSSAFTRAAAALMRPSQRATGTGIGSPETGKFSTAFRVSPPQSSRAVVAIAPSLSRWSLEPAHARHGQDRQVQDESDRSAAPERLRDAEGVACPPGEDVPDGDEGNRPEPVVGAHTRQRRVRDALLEGGLPEDAEGRGARAGDHGGGGRHRERRVRRERDHEQHLGERAAGSDEQRATESQVEHREAAGDGADAGARAENAPRAGAAVVELRRRGSENVRRREDDRVREERPEHDREQPAPRPHLAPALDELAEEVRRVRRPLDRRDVDLQQEERAPQEARRV